MRIHLGLRDWGAAEWWAGARAVLGLLEPRTSEQAVARWFEEAFGRPALVVHSGSAALQIALKCLRAERPERTEVVLPALACPALNRAVRACGLQPVHADIGIDLNTPVETVRNRVGARTLAVVLVHAYGLAADAAGLTALCRDAGVALVDDSAQRVDPASRLGTAGDFGIFSFAQSKSVVAGINGSGGVLLINSGRHLAAAVRHADELPPATGRTAAWFEFMATPHAPRLAYYLARWRQSTRDCQWVPARIGAVDAAIAMQQLASLSVRRSRRLELLSRYRDALASINAEAPQMRDGQDIQPLARLMVRIVRGQRRTCREVLQRVGVTSRLPYDVPESMVHADFPQATLAAETLLELPLASDAGELEVRHVVAAAAPYLARTATV